MRRKGADQAGLVGPKAESLSDPGGNEAPTMPKRVVRMKPLARWGRVKEFGDNTRHKPIMIVQRMLIARSSYKDRNVTTLLLSKGFRREARLGFRREARLRFVPLSAPPLAQNRYAANEL